MMTTFTGRRSKRGDWVPEVPLLMPPIFALPFRPLAILRWLLGWPGYLFPWGVVYMAFPVLTWLYLTPAMESMRAFAPGWILYILVRNYALIFLVAGAWHLRLYGLRAQGTDFKYTNKWLANNNTIFLFSNQLIDNLFWTVVSSVPIWTTYEVVTMWLYANKLIPYVSWADHPIYCAILMLVIPLIRDVHFFLIHRLIHWGPLYRWVHYLHHNNVDCGPFTGLSMHPVEHIAYFSGVILHWVLPSHPIHALFHLQHAALSPAQGHAGFDRIVMGDGVGVKTGDYFHYLHHKYFECNYGADGGMPLDEWFGSFNDGTQASIDAMNERFIARAQQKQRAEGSAS